MKRKLMFIVPALAMLVIYVIAGLMLGFDSIMWTVWLFIALMLIGGILMAFGKWYGCLGGIIPGIFYIITGMSAHGQVMDIEVPVGVALIICYLIFAALSLKKSKRG